MVSGRVTHDDLAECPGRLKDCLRVRILSNSFVYTFFGLQLKGFGSVEHRKCFGYLEREYIPVISSGILSCFLEVILGFYGAYGISDLYIIIAFLERRKYWTDLYVPLGKASNIFSKFIPCLYEFVNHVNVSRD